ncbi:hypothetical protein D0Z70_07455 [Sphingobium terrigena]|uniref:Uncharacterized protein n=1 Tax=Sphingobium terrigena TaxID=2304063 RepID=A0A418YUM1_9SPHN|nr:hypothetical protein [Sphingobium terrigena]RJG55864.1 hypothetical protein D0Z70_07455 [Sphingobium terrigena]
MQRNLFLAIRRIEEGLALLDGIGMGASMSAIHAQWALDHAKRHARGRPDEGDVREPIQPFAVHSGQSMADCR